MFSEKERAIIVAALGGLVALDTGEERLALQRRFEQPLTDLPAIKALIRYAADSPDIVCEEGYWDDGCDSACADGMNQARSEAAAVIRDALKALGIEPPKGVHVCPECFRDDSDGHAAECATGQAEAEAEDEAAEELTAL
jgi:hypothetical protein